MRPIVAFFSGVILISALFLMAGCSVLFLGSASSKSSNEAVNQNYLLVNMPLSLANDKEDA